MALSVYPAGLPNPAVTFAATPVERRKLSPGTVATELRWFEKGFRAEVEIQFMFRAADAEIFRAWWETELLNGGAWFTATWPAPWGYVPMRYKFKLPSLVWRDEGFEYFGLSGQAWVSGPLVGVSAGGTPAPGTTPEPAPPVPPSTDGTSTANIVALDYTQDYSQAADYARYGMVIRGFTNNKAATVGSTYGAALVTANPTIYFADYVIVNEVVAPQTIADDKYLLYAEVLANDWWAYNEPTHTRTQWTSTYSTYNVNITTAAPTNGSGDRYPQFAADWYDSHRFGYIPQVNWLFCDNTWKRPRNVADWNRDGVNETATDAEAAFTAGHVAFATALRSVLPGVKLVCNTDNDLSNSFSGVYNAGFNEGCVGRSYGTFAIGGMLAVRTRQLRLIANTIDGIAILNCYAESTDYKTLRLGFTMAVMFDSWYAPVDSTPELHAIWMDEFAVQLGVRTDAIPSAAYSNGVWMCRTESGMVLCNPQNVAATISISTLGSYKRFVGTQDPTTNNGATITGPLTIPALDGLVLINVSIFRNVIFIDAGAISLQGYAPTIVQLTGGVNKKPGTGSISLRHSPPLRPTATLNINRVLTPAAGSITLTGHTPTVTTPTVTLELPAAGEIVITGYAPFPNGPALFTPDAGAIVLTGYAPVVNANLDVFPGASAITLTGYAPSTAEVLMPGAGVITVTGLTPSVAGSTLLAPSTGSITTTAYAPTVLADTVIAIDGGDPYYANVVLLLHGDGSNGSTDIIDSSILNNTVTVSGSNSITTSSPKFGTGALQGVSGGYFRVAIGSAASMTGDFTIEMWIDGGSNNVVFYSESGGGYLYNGAFQSYGGSNLNVTTNLTGGTYHHLAISRTGSSLKAFLDGVQDGSVTYSGTVDLQTLVFGRYVPNNNLHWDGKWDDIRVTKGTGRYTGNFSVPTAAFGSGFVQLTLTGLAPTVVRGTLGQQPGAGSITTAGNAPTLVNGSQAFPGSASDADYSSVVLLLHFDGSNASTTFTDSSSYARSTSSVAGNAQLTTASPYTGSACGTFDGSGDYISYATSSDFNIFGADFTVELSIKFSSAVANQCIIEFGTDTNNRANLSLVSGNIVFYTQTTAPNGNTRISATAPSTGVWHAVALVKSGSTFTLYIDGISRGTSTTTIYPTSSNLLGVGSGTPVGGAANDYNGQIDELRITKGVARFTSAYYPTAHGIDTVRLTGLAPSILRGTSVQPGAGSISTL